MIQPCHTRENPHTISSRNRIGLKYCKGDLVGVVIRLETFREMDIRKIEECFAVCITDLA